MALGANHKDVQVSSSLGSRSPNTTLQYQTNFLDHTSYPKKIYIREPSSPINFTPRNHKFSAKPPVSPFFASLESKHFEFV